MKAITSTTAAWNAGTVGANHSLATEAVCTGRFNSVTSAKYKYGSPLRLVGQGRWLLKPETQVRILPGTPLLT